MLEIRRVVPVDWYELLIELNDNRIFSFEPEKLELYTNYKFLAYPDKLRRFAYDAKSIKWKEGFKVSVNFILGNCKLLSQEELNRKSITIARKNNAPTTTHLTHHIYSVHILPYNEIAPIGMWESIAGGIGDMGGGKYYSLDELVKLDFWKKHFLYSDCDWGISTIESESHISFVLQKLISDFMTRKYSQ